MIKIRAPKLIDFLTGKHTVIAMSVFCFLLYRDELTDIDINHEEIHWKQCRELLFLGFWGMYLYFNWRKSYNENPFELEAYDNERNLNYLKDRKPFSWRNYL